MPDTDQGGSTNIESGGDTSVGGDIVGRDKITTTTNTANVGADSVAGDKIVQEGGPTARYAVIGIVVVAALAILVLAAVALGGRASIVATSTLPATTPTPPTPLLHETPSHTPEPPVSPVPATTEPPSSTPTFTFTSSSTPTTETPTPSDTPFPTNTLTLTPTPSPTSALGVYDDFGDRCLDSDKWALPVATAGPETPTPTSVFSRGNCLDTRREFLTEDGDGHLSVFLTLEGEVSDSVAQKSNACYKEAEVTLALHDAMAFDEEVRAVYLGVGLLLARVSGDYFLEVRLEANSASGKEANGQLRPQINARLSLLNSGGPTTLGTLPYRFDQLVTVAFRLNNRQQLVAYVDGQPIGPPLSVLSDPCGLTLSHHADTSTLLDGYFDEARLEPLPANQ